MYCRLSSVEILAYYGILTSCMFYSLYNLYKAGDNLSYWAANDYLDSGWSFLGRKIDISHDNWSEWKPFILQIPPWISIQLIIALVIRWLSIQLLPLWYLSISALFVLHNFGPEAFWYLMFQPCLMYLILQTGSRTAIYIAGMFSLVILNTDWILLLPLWYLSISALFVLHNFGPEAFWYLMFQPCLMYLILQTGSRTAIYIAGMFSLVILNTDWILVFLNLGYIQQYLIFVSSYWTMMRVQSFCHERLTLHKPASVADFILFLSYCFYLPLMFLGPLVLFEKFEKGVTKASEPWKLPHVIKFGCNLMRYTAWMFVYELMLHYLYVSALQKERMHIYELSAWAEYGIVYATGILFCVKYIVTYGLSVTISRFEEIDAPNPPRCLAHVHLHGEIWRTFDEGLHFFLKRYIYVPLMGTKPGILRKLYSSFMCFAFVYVWHRTHIFILIWSAMNYAGIAVEVIARNIASHTKYQHFEKSILSSANIRRFHALLGSMAFITFVLSNLYFVTGTSLGNHFFKRLLRASWQEIFVLVLPTYCLAQVSIETKRLEQEKKSKLE